MRLHVSVHGLHFVVPCGEGAQSVKWLGLAVAQRYALAAPHGRCRTREDAHIKPGFFLPASIAKTNGGQVLLPSQKIADACKDNDHVTVLLQQEVPVNEIGAPQFSAWATSAFSSQNKSSSDSLATAGAKAPSSSPPSDAKTGSGTSSARAEQKEMHVETKPHEDEIKQYARSEMLQQVNSGQFQSEMELEAAFLYDWSRLRMDELEKDAKERDAMQEILLSNFGCINAAYMHYAVGSGETSYGMNGHELAHFLHECGLCEFERDAPMLEKLYAQCLRNDTFQSIFGHDTLARVGFFHALLRVVLSSLKPASGTTPREFLEMSFKKHVVPTVARLTTGPFRDHTHRDKSVALFQEIKPKLLKLYAKYAQEHGGREAQSGANPGWPQLLTATGLKSMLYDCGIFCVGDTTAHDEIFNQAVGQCFSGMRDGRVFDEQPLVFAEFMEVLTRVGMAVLDDSGLSPTDAIKITLDALRSLPVKPLHK